MLAPRPVTSVGEWDTSSGTAPLSRWLLNTETAMNSFKVNQYSAQYRHSMLQVYSDHEAILSLCN